MFDPKTLKAGDEVGVHGHYEHQDDIRTVVKVNGHGHIALDDGHVYDKRGHVRGTGRTWLCDPQRIRDRRAEKVAARDRSGRAQELTAKLEELIRGKRNGYGELCVGFTAEEKAELVRLVENLPNS